MEHNDPVELTDDEILAIAGGLTVSSSYTIMIRNGVVTSSGDISDVTIGPGNSLSSHTVQTVTAG